MHRRTYSKLVRGFTLTELMLAMALSLLLMAGAVRLFKDGLEGTFLTSQQTQMQEDARAAENLLTKDLSLAGAGGLPVGGIALPSGAGSVAPKYACGPAGSGPGGANCYLPDSTPVGISFPHNQLYYIIPGYKKGPTINTTAGATDAVTVTYADTTFRLNQYAVTFNNTSGSSVTFTAPAAPPSPPGPPQAVNDSSLGLQTGDLVLFQNAAGGMAVGEVTAPVVKNSSTQYTVTFATNDPLSLNQSVPSGSMSQITSGPAATATRIWVISYYLNILPPASGTGTGTPRL